MSSGIVVAGLTPLMAWAGVPGADRTQILISATLGLFNVALGVLVHGLHQARLAGILDERERELLALQDPPSSSTAAVQRSLRVSQSEPRARIDQQGEP